MCIRIVKLARSTYDVLICFVSGLASDFALFSADAFCRAVTLLALRIQRHKSCSASRSQHHRRTLCRRLADKGECPSLVNWMRLARRQRRSVRKCNAASVSRAPRYQDTSNLLSASIAVQVQTSPASAGADLGALHVVVFAIDETSKFHRSGRARVSDCEAPCPDTR